VGEPPAPASNSAKRFQGLITGINSTDGAFVWGQPTLLRKTPVQFPRNEHGLSLSLHTSNTTIHTSSARQFPKRTPHQTKPGNTAKSFLFFFFELFLPLPLPLLMRHAETGNKAAGSTAGTARQQLSPAWSHSNALSGCEVCSAVGRIHEAKVVSRKHKITATCICLHCSICRRP
jgi:hypothetical protein